MNCLAGIAPANADPEKIRVTFVDNLSFAADELEAAGIKLLIEPVNTYDIPGFWLSLNLIYLFAVRLGWLPAAGYVSIFSDPAAGLRYMVLPALSLGFNQSALIARIARSCMLEVLQQDYIRTARAKGLSNRVVIYVHAFRNALVPVVTVIGITTAVLIGGAVVTEIVFNIPGLGRLIISAILRRDYPVVQGVVLVTAATYVLINLTVDLLYAVIDPRIRYE